MSKSLLGLRVMKCGCLSCCRNCTSRPIKFKPDCINAPSDLVCPVCLCVAFQPPQLECNHIVCIDCLSMSKVIGSTKCKCGACNTVLKQEEFDKIIEQSGPLVKEQQIRAASHNHNWLYWQCPHCLKAVTDVSISTINKNAISRLKNLKYKCKYEGCGELIVFGEDQLAPVKHDEICKYKNSNINVDFIRI